MPLPRFGEGGPSLLKNKAFFFFNMEKPHTITPTDPVFVTVPTALERIGNFSQSKNSSGATPVILDPLTGLQFPGNIIPAGRLNQSMQNVLNYYPLPNSATAAIPGRYTFQRSVDVPKHSYLFRLDFKVTNKDNCTTKLSGGRRITRGRLLWLAQRIKWSRSLGNSFALSVYGQRLAGLSELGPYLQFKSRE